MRDKQKSKMPIAKSDEEIDAVCDTFKNASLNGSLMDESSLSGENEELTCPSCNESFTSTPRILSCLHVFCENCLNKKLNNDSASAIGKHSISCPLCKQVTNVAMHGISSLACDYVVMNTLEMGAINGSTLLCTSCKKANEQAVARCADCPHFLCPNCNSAHQYMRCFESHHVVMIEEIKSSKEKSPIHKPIRCEAHRQIVHFYCHSCEEPICSDCTQLEHKSPNHSYERLDVAILKERQKLEMLIEDTRTKLNEFQQLGSTLENALGELQTKHDTAKDLINETYQSYKALLEKRRDEMLEELGKLHSHQELKVMDAFQDMQKNIEQINLACGFTSRILDNGNDAEVLSLKRLLASQLNKIVTSPLKPDITVNLEFVTNFDKFQGTMKEVFGQLHDPDTNKDADRNAQCNGTGNHIELLDVNSVLLGNSLGINCLNGTSVRSSPVNSSPISMPSFDGEVNGFMALPPPHPTSPLDGLSIQEFNLNRLASMATGVDKTSPPMTTNGVPPGFGLDLLGQPDMTSSNLLSNIQALAKMGNANLNDSDLMGDGFNGMPPTGMMGPSFPSVGDNSVMDLVGGSSMSMMNGHGSSFDNMPMPSAPYYQHHSTNSTLEMGNNAMEAYHQNHMTNFSRVGSQRVSLLEIHFKFGQLGPTPCHFNSPHGFCIAEDDCIVVADTNNHRIQIFSKDGEFCTQFGVAGKVDGQLWYPRKVELLPSGRFVICDRGSERSRLQLFSKQGMFIKKIRLKFVDIVAGMTVTDKGHVVVVDSVQPTLYKLDENAELNYWFECGTYMTEPSDVAVRDGRCYICDFKGHYVAVFSEDGTYLNRIGHQGLTDYPNGIDILRNGNILVGDSHGNKFHICIFSHSGNLLCEYECPYVKVSRCCGLKVTSEGYIITVAKNNHHVLVLNSPFSMYQQSS